MSATPLSPESRQKATDAAFDEGEVLLPGRAGKVLALRPFAPGFVRYVDSLGLTFLQGAELEKGELFRQLAIFAWFHSEPIAVVLQHIRRDTWREAAELWEFEHLTPDGIKDLLTEIPRWAAQADAAVFDLQPRSDDSDSDSSEDPPGNC